MKTRLVAFLLAVAVVVLVSTRPPAEREANAQSGGGYLPRGTAWNVSSVSSGSTVFVTSLTTTQSASAIRVSVVLGSSAPLAVVWSDAGGHTFTNWLNGGTNLGAGQAFTFVFGARNSKAPGGGTAGTGTDPLAFNFVVGSPTTVPILWCEELTSGVD